MASKTYTVKKNGTILKELKTLAAAKKLANAEGAVAEAVYNDDVEPAVDTLPALDAMPASVETATTAPVETEIPCRYRLTHLMNVRSSPSMEANKLYTLPAGEEVSVLDVVDDWLHLADGTFILYSGGKFAEKL